MGGDAVFDGDGAATRRVKANADRFVRLRVGKIAFIDPAQIYLNRSR